MIQKKLATVSSCTFFPGYSFTKYSVLESAAEFCKVAMANSKLNNCFNNNLNY